MQWKNISGLNAGYIVELYERYQENPEAVDSAARTFFEQWQPPAARPDGAGGLSEASVSRVMGAVNLAQAIREYGHLAARLDPLGNTPPGDPALQPDYHGVTEADLRDLPAHLIGGPAAEGHTTAAEAITALRNIYSGHIGYDYDHLRLPKERAWLRNMAESGHFKPPNTPINKEKLLKKLTKIEAFEQFLHRSFPGKTRFSIEGLDMIVPMLNEMLTTAAQKQIRNILIGMAHRGRLNVLAHILNKPYENILIEFKDPSGELRFREDLGWTGDVKYHEGASRAIEEDTPANLIITIPPNPSHLETVNPVVEGMARAAGTTVNQPGPPTFDYRHTLPVLIHGDASFPAQGMVAETLNLAGLTGYQTGGTIHIIANNQLGYTTLPQTGRSTLYAGDLAKGFKIPIVHVNADSPEACLEAARLAFAYREKFQKDFLIDLIGYRRFGHNEGDEPGFTQPKLYKRIQAHPTVRKQWADTLIEADIIDQTTAETWMTDHLETLQTILDNLEPKAKDIGPQLEPPPPGQAKQVETALPLEELKSLHQELLKVPGNFHLNSKLKKAIKRRRDFMQNPAKPTIDWNTAENLALASILAEGIAIRMTGEDVERGTFSQRHAVFHDTEVDNTYTPLQSIPQAKAAFEIHNSPLSESAVLGFEYGYNIQSPDRLIIWEAQFGDFVNNAQVIIDEFIAAGRAKWEQTPSLILLLPHGYEGQGPDHSNAYLSRFLQLAAETNMRIANCTTAAQYFHLLRRQARLLKTDPLPLIIFTPKSLLRHPQTASPPNHLANGRWQPVIHENQAEKNPQEIKKLLVCSGKIYVDLISSDYYENDHEQNYTIDIIRLEQLYPFPFEELTNLFNRYPNLEEVVWVQEEPANMGAWEFSQPYLRHIINGRWPLRYIGRPGNASPAEGSSAWHKSKQAALIKRAFNPEGNKSSS